MADNEEQSTSSAETVTIDVNEESGCGPSTEPEPGTTPETPSLKISKNCKRFNRLFHSSFDESDESSMNSTCSSSKSFECKQPIIKTESNLAMEEILLEIEIQVEEDEEDLNDMEVEDKKLFVGIKHEEDPDILSIIKEQEDVTNESESEKLIKKEPESPNLSVSISSPENEDEELELDDDEEEVIKKPRVKREKKLKHGNSVGKRKSSRLPPKATFCNKTHEAQIMKRVRPRKFLIIFFQIFYSALFLDLR